MPLPVKSLPTIQNWDCHGCGDCCRLYNVRVTDEEKSRIEAQDWSAELPGVAPVVFDKSLGGHRLAQTTDGTCVFLGPDNRCRIHAKYGPAAKPRVCRLFPFVFTPAGDHWRVGVRYGCPSAADNKGRPVTAHADDLKEYAALLDAPPSADPPPLRPGQSVSWPDLLRFVKAIGEQLADTATPIEHRLRKVVALAALCRKATFEKVTGGRLREFLEVVSGAVMDEVPLYPKDVAEPGWTGRTVFRQTVAVYCRTDTGPNAGVAREGWLTRVKATWRFARGKGPIPRLHGLMPETTFEDVEQFAGELSAASNEMLTRYYRVKVESLQFFGPPNYGRPFWEGLDSLMMTFPVMMWLSRVLTTGGARPRDEAVKVAMQIVDHNFGFNPLLAAGRQSWALQSVAEKGELDRLIAWYAR